MINYISNVIAIEELNKYLNTIKKEERCYYLEKNVEEYMFSGIFNFSNLLKKYFTKIEELLKYYCDSDLLTLKDNEKIWNVCIIKEEMFSKNIFVLKDIIFINLSKILDVVNFSFTNINIGFIKELMEARIYMIQYYNFEKWKLYIEEHNNCNIIKKNNFILNNELKIYKNINISFMDEYFCVHGNEFEYIIIDTIEDNNFKYSPFFDVKVIKVNEFIIDFDEIIGVDTSSFITNYFEEYNFELVNYIFDNYTF